MPECENPFADMDEEELEEIFRVALEPIREAFEGIRKDFQEVRKAWIGYGRMLEYQLGTMKRED